MKIEVKNTPQLAAVPPRGARESGWRSFVRGWVRTWAEIGWYQCDSAAFSPNSRVFLSLQKSTFAPKSSRRANHEPLVQEIGNHS